MKYIVLFVILQLIFLALFIPGLVLCALPYNMIPWMWRNDLDPIPNYVWLALRNPVSNMRLVPGVSKIGRPYWRKTWGAKPGGFYAHAGWNASGYPVLSAGRNPNAF